MGTSIHSSSIETQEWYTAAQIYMWESWSDAVYGNAFDLTSGEFQVASGDQTSTLMNDVNYLETHADTSVIASLNVPVSLLQNATGALYSDVLSGSTRYFKDSESSQEFLTMPTTSVPEPGTLLLLGSALAGLGGVAWGRRTS